MAHDSCENVKSGSSSRNGGASGQEQRARASLAQLLQRSSGTGLSRHAGALHGSRDVYGAPDMPWGVLGAQAPWLLQLLYAGEAGDPILQMRVEERKGPPVPQPVTNKHELPNPRIVCMSLSLTLPGPAWQGRGRAWQVPPSTAAEPTGHTAGGGDGSGARLAAGECWREYCSLRAERMDTKQQQKAGIWCGACVGCEVKAVVMSAASCGQGTAGRTATHSSGLGSPLCDWLELGRPQELSNPIDPRGTRPQKVWVGENGGVCIGESLL